MPLGFIELSNSIMFSFMNFTCLYKPNIETFSTVQIKHSDLFFGWSKSRDGSTLLKIIETTPENTVIGRA
jgi:hypothetical protein